MDSKYVKRFNVYTQIFSSDEQHFYLESWDGKNWNPVIYQGNRLNFDSLDSVAKRIVQISPSDSLYKRVVFSDKVLDTRDGRLEGICLNNENPYLMDSLTRDEKRLLLAKINKYFPQMLKGNIF